MEKDNFKLPKSWKHWVKSAGLRFHSCGTFSRSKNSVFSMRGHGRNWRINCYGEFQCSEIYDTFDRWANSHEKTFLLPKTKNEFVQLVKGYIKS